MSAVTARDPRIAQILLDHGADPSAATRYERYGDQVSNVMEIALQSGDTSIIRVIRDAINRSETSARERAAR